MILAIDLGGTEVKMGRADRLGNLYETISASVSFDGYKTPLLETVLKTAETFLASWPEKPDSTWSSSHQPIGTIPIWPTGNQPTSPAMQAMTRNCALSLKSRCR